MSDATDLIDMGYGLHPDGCDAGWRGSIWDDLGWDDDYDDTECEECPYYLESMPESMEGCSCDECLDYYHEQSVKAKLLYKGVDQFIARRLHDEIIRSDRGFPSRSSECKCGKPVTIISISFGAGFCSPACLIKMNNEFKEWCEKERT